MARGQSPRRAVPKQVGSLHHSDKRRNIPTAEMQSFFQREEDHSAVAAGALSSGSCHWRKASTASATPTATRSSSGTACASP